MTHDPDKQFVAALVAMHAEIIAEAIVTAARGCERIFVAPSTRADALLDALEPAKPAPAKPERQMWTDEHDSRR